LVNREINATLEIDKGGVAPEASLYFLTRDDLTGVLNEKEENL
jgi:hypothetical protein